MKQSPTFTVDLEADTPLSKLSRKTSSVSDMSTSGIAGMKYREGYFMTSTAFSKIHNLNLIIGKHHTNTY